MHWYLIVTAALLLGGRAAAQDTQPVGAPSPPRTPVAPPAMTVDLEVIIDPRIELMLIVQYLIGDYERRTNLIPNFDFEYKREIEEHFRPFAEHAAVAAFAVPGARAIREGPCAVGDTGGVLPRTAGRV